MFGGGKVSRLSLDVESLSIDGYRHTDEFGLLDLFVQLNKRTWSELEVGILNTIRSPVLTLP